MSKKDEALKLALEALEVLGWQTTEEAMDYRDNAIDAIRESLAEQPARQQVPERMKPFVQRHHITSAEFTAFHVGFCCGEEFSKQQQEPVAICEYCEKERPVIQAEGKPWVGLTKQEQASVLASVPTVPFEGGWHLALLTAIEAKLREKNA